MLSVTTKGRWSLILTVICLFGSTCVKVLNLLCQLNNLNVTQPSFSSTIRAWLNQINSNLNMLLWYTKGRSSSILTYIVFHHWHSRVMSLNLAKKKSLKIFSEKTWPITAKLWCTGSLDVPLQKYLLTPPTNQDSRYQPTEL